MTAADVEGIGRRVRRSAPAEREQLLAALGELADGLDASPRAQALVGEILTGLAEGAGPDLRGQLADWAARGRCATRALAIDLASDGIEVAGPVIRRSPALAAEDLLRLVADGRAEHQMAVGRRPHLETAVVEAILEQGDPDALTALAGNTDAPLAPEHMALLVGMAKRLPGLRAPLARRVELTREMAQALAEVSGLSTRRALRARFGGLATNGFAVAPEGAERRLVAKLQAAGQLSAGYALRVLREGALTLFEHALAALAQAPHQEVRAALEADGAADLLDLCRAAGLDRSVTPLVLDKVRELNGGRPGDAEPAPPQVKAAAPKRSAKRAAGKPRTARKTARKDGAGARKRAARRTPGE